MSDFAWRRIRRQPGFVIASTLVALAAPADATEPCPKLRLNDAYAQEFSRIVWNDYQRDVPADADDQARRAAADTAITRATQGLLLLFTTAVADAIVDEADQATRARFDEAVAKGAAIVARMHEVARTDQQNGAAATVSGSTSAATATGIPSIVSMAIEHGTVQREDSGTGATFTTSPYALILLGREDTDTVFNDHAFLRRFGFAATLDLQESKSAGAGDFAAEDVSAVSTSFRMFGDRSARTDAFKQEWQAAGIDAAKREVAEAGVQRNQEILQKSRELRQAMLKSFGAGTVDGDVRRSIREVLVQQSDDETAIAALVRATESALCEHVVTPIASGAIPLAGVDPNAAVAAAASGVIALHGAQTMVDALLEDFNARPVVTLHHTWNRSTMGSDYSDLVIAADGEVRNVPYASARLPLAPWTLVLNGTIGLNHDADEAMGQDTIRDFGIVGGLEKSVANPLNIGNAAEAAARMKLSLTGRYVRQQDIDADIGVVQGRVAVPLVRGFAFVVAVNYASRTETDSRDEFRLAGGLEFNGNMLASQQALQALLAQAN